MVISTQPVVSSARNGVGTFIHQCKRLEFHYCDRGGSSYGMRTFLQTQLAPLASRTPHTTHHVSPRPHKHPVIRASYVNGAERVVCVRNLTPEQILQKVELLRSNSGQKNRRLQGGKFVSSENESVRGVWSAIHAARLDAEAGRDVWAWNGKGGKKGAILRDQAAVAASRDTPVIGQSTSIPQPARIESVV